MGLSQKDELKSNANMHNGQATAGSHFKCSLWSAHVSGGLKKKTTKLSHFNLHFYTNDAENKNNSSSQVLIKDVEFISTTRGTPVCVSVRR